MRRLAGLLILGVGKVVSFELKFSTTQSYRLYRVRVFSDSTASATNEFLNTLDATNVYEKQRGKRGEGRCSEMRPNPKEAKPYRSKVF